MNNFISHDIMEKFRLEHFQKSPFVLTGVDASKLVSWQALNKTLEKDILHYPRVRLANDNWPEMRGYGGFVRYSYSQSGDRTPHINRHQLYKCLREGATLVLDRCQAFFDSVDHMRQWLSSQLECSCSANLYAAFTPTPSFGLHFDNHDVLAVQIEGIKRWTVHKPTYSYPLEHERSFDFIAPKTEPDFIFDVEPGQAIYLPAGYWHNASTQTSRSLHVSYTIIRPRRLDIFRTLLEELSGNEYIRAPIEFGDRLSDDTALRELINEAVKKLDIKLNETMLKIQCNAPAYKHINLELLD
ncbi:JmjC domain-containing protein [Leclercia adecarboxylata]|uniref:JmjC domain-containing protein n=1 Tax=Leclercia adecarboxylata TaxID=83655 RepID=UPI000579F1C3|nr:cupin domain-containing protein [Leclercia adecarboxylata]